MANIVWYACNSLVTIHQAMIETPPDTGLSNPLTGWVVGKTAAGNYSRLVSQREHNGFGATILPDGTIQTNSGDCLRTANTYNGNFAAGNWTLNFHCQAVTNGGDADGNIGIRLFRDTQTNGSSATQITATRIEGGGVTDLAVDVGQTSTAIFSLGAFGVSSEYVFAQIGWEITGAGGNNNRDVLMLLGNSGTMLISTDFTAASNPQTFPVSLAGVALTAGVFQLGVGKQVAAQTIMTGNMTRETGKVMPAESIFAATMTTLYEFILQGRAVIGSWVGGLGGFVESVAQTFNQTMAAETILTPNVNRVLTMFRTLAAETAGAADITKLMTLARTLAAQTIGAVTLTAVASFFRTLAATTIGEANITRLMTLFRTLAAEARYVAAIAADSSVAQEFAQAMAAVMIGAANLARQASLARTLAAETISAANIAKLLTMARTLAAETIGTASITRVVSFFRALAAETIGEANIARLMAFARTLAAEARHVASIFADSSVAQEFGQAMAAVMVGAAEINRQASLLRTMAAEAVFAASLATLSLFARTLAAVTEGVTAISRLMTLTRTLAAEAIFEPVISRLMTLFRTLAATHVGEAVVTATQLFLVTAIEGFHMASQRITSFVRGRLHRKSSMTLPHTTRTQQGSRRTGARKRGDDDTDAE